MTNLPARWNIHIEAETIPKGKVLYQDLNMTSRKFNTLSSCTLLGAALAAATSQSDPNIMSSHVTQQLCVAKISFFASMREESVFQ